MLKRMILIAILLALIWPLGYEAVAGVACTRSDEAGRCMVSAEVTSGNSDAKDSKGRAASVGSSCVDEQGTVMPCMSPLGWWSNSYDCYLKVVEPQPEPTYLDLWINAADKKPAQLLFSCRHPAYLISARPFVWISAAEAGPDPAVVARVAVSEMSLSAIKIGMVPEPLPGRIGIIGYPQWMWVESPTENTVGPMTRTVTQDGVTVTATAKMTKVVWDMGDGSVVTCKNAGTKYEDKYGKAPSPSCGYYYTKQGSYTVTATSYWDVAWTGMGQSGNIPMKFSQKTPVTMGEVQVLTTSGRS